ncbi:MAG: MBL fold metallo-hydrolase [Verrucomicrobiota bacterium JB025]|nr:MBL fold metallo-hydrolase [Verrucomicrobiota bacterium JB025]
MFLKQITDPSLAQNAYLIGCQKSGEAILIDPERDVDRYLEIAAENDLKIVAVTDTHIHADYLSGTRELIEHHGAHAYITTEGGPDWQMKWAAGAPRTTGIRHGDSIQIGNIELRVLRTPGHTPEHVSFLVTDHGGGADQPIALLSGDFIFVGDVGRPDLLESAAGIEGTMESSAKALYHSLRETGELPEFLQILPAHGAGSSCGKALGAIPASVLGYERRFNPALHQALTGPERQFVDNILSDQPEPPVYFARMKRDNRDGQPLLPNGKLPRPKRLTATELATFASNPQHTVLDLRNDRVAFAANHLKGALHAPLDGTQFPEMLGSFVDPSSPLVLLVNDESQVATAVRQAVRIGCDHLVGWMPVHEALETTAPMATLKRITTADLPDAVAAEPGIVLDVRSAAEFARGAFPGATRIAHTRLSAHTGEIPRNGKIYVHCRSGVRAAKASSFLAKLGRNVVYVDGPVAALLETAPA